MMSSLNVTVEYTIHAANKNDQSWTKTTTMTSRSSSHDCYIAEQSYLEKSAHVVLWWQLKTIWQSGKRPFKKHTALTLYRVRVSCLWFGECGCQVNEDTMVMFNGIQQPRLSLLLVLFVPIHPLNWYTTPFSRILHERRSVPFSSLVLRPIHRILPTTIHLFAMD